MRRILTSIPAAALAFTLLLAACAGSDSAPGTATDGSGAVTAADDAPVVVVTTNLLGDIVTSALGDLVGTALRVDVIMPVGADPHEFAPSARQAEAMEQADLLIVNGLGAEGAMTDIIDAVGAGGTPVFAVANAVGDDVIEGDPHVWLDPDAMATAVEAMASALVDATGIDRAEIERTTSAYAGRLRELDASIASALAEIPAEQRVLVTNHDALAYFARRYDFRVDGTVIPSVSTSAEPSAADLEALAELIRAEGVPAIFVETTESDRLARAVADEVGDIALVELYTGSLGDADSGATTYVDAMTLNAQRIREAFLP